MRPLVLGGLILACAAPRGAPPPAPSPPPEEVLRIVAVNDLHLKDEASVGYPAKVVAAMNAEGAQLALVCGDLATDGKEEELRLARRVLEGLAIPWYPVIGNHDAVGTGETEETVWKTVFGQSETTYAFESHGIHFVAVDPGCGCDYERNEVRPPALARLAAIAAGIPDGAPVILFSHYPYGPGVRYRTPNADEVLAVFGRHRLLAVISGHFHGNTEVRAGGVLFTTTATASSTRKNHDGTEAKGYRVFTVRNRREITTAFREVPP